MHRGRIAESGPTEQVLSRPGDPYTVRLLESVPRAEAGWLAGAQTLNSGAL
jgi:ABC-type dipeptide/oligopeptide/nickel transport system ATPase component